MLLYLLPTILVGWALIEIFDSSSSDSSDETPEETPPETPTGPDLIGGDQEGEDDSNIVEGTADADALSGTEGNDIVRGGAGNDGVLAGAGDDILLGEGDDDRLRGEDGSDLIIGGDGNDALFGAQGNDWVEGDAGNDTVNGGLGTDILLGGTGEDVLNGGANSDLLFGGDITGTPLSEEQLIQLRDGTPLADILGVAGTDLAPLVDDGEADVLNGDVGSDVLILGAGDTGTGDAEGGGTQQDLFLVFADQPEDSEPATITDFGASETIGLITGANAAPVVTIGEDGDDALILADGQVVARVTGAAGTIEPSDISLFDGPTIDDIDPNGGQVIEPTTNTATLTDEADDFTGADNVRDRIDAAAGDDTLQGLGEDDRLRAEEGNDIALGGDGDDTLLGGTGSDLLFGEAGNDRVTGGSESDYVDGGSGADQLEGNAQDDVVIGGADADNLSGGNGEDVLAGGDLLDRPLTVAELQELRSNPNADLGDIAGLGVGALDDGAADILNGGNGSDVLILGAGDTGTGGEGVDAFYITNGDGTAPAIIADLEATDEIVLLKPDAAAAGVITTAADGNDTLVSLDGVVQARVVGVDPAGLGPVVARDPLTIDDVVDLTQDAPDAVLRTTLTEEDDTFVATGGNVADRVDALAGDDLVNGGGDNDVLRGDEGADILIGGDGDDELFGAVGSDLMQGNGGDDALFGGAESDLLDGGDGDDALIANGGDDIAIGGDGADVIQGNIGDDLLIGGNLFATELTQEDLVAIRDGEEALPAAADGNLDDGEVDLLDGGVGDDILIGASGDQMTGGDGADLFATYVNNPTEAVIVNDYNAADDSLAVVYDNGVTEPVITVTDNGEGVFTVLADGAPVAVVASADTEITAADVLLVQRGEDGSIGLIN